MTFRYQKTAKELTAIALKAAATRRANAAAKAAALKPPDKPPAKVSAQPVTRRRVVAGDLWGHDIAGALREHHGDKLRAARALGISVERLTKRIAEYELHDLVQEQPPKRVAAGQRNEAKPDPMSRAEGVELLRSVIREIVGEELKAIFSTWAEPKTESRDDQRPIRLAKFS